ncbi:hypothetical protein LBMAG42_06960 [Deltaproteobacteria bacterium]|nr:hypothetical protein LBMAG42_06960 [Deltaproteobacteria bacterium]
MTLLVAWFATACVKPAAELEVPVERDDPVAAASPESVLFAALSAEDMGVRAIAAQALVRYPPASQAGGLGLATALDASPDDRVRLAVIAALRERLDEPEVQAHLVGVARGDTGANLRVRGYAALAVTGHFLMGEQPALEAEIAGFGLTTPAVGEALGLLAASWDSGSAEAAVRLRVVMTTATLPLELPFFAALRDRHLPWSVALAHAEPEARGMVACGMLVASSPSGMPAGRVEAASLLHSFDADVRFDAAAILRDCPAPAAGRLLAGSGRPEARLARVARGELPPGVAAELLAGELWPDAVRALAARSDEAAHAPLRAFAAEHGDLEREVVAVGLATSAVSGDVALLQSLETDASLRTRVAAAAARLRLAAAPR